jgi:hypothetical protein
MPEGVLAFGGLKDFDVNAISTNALIYAVRIVLCA